MYKKTIIIFLLFLAPIAVIEQHKKDKFSQIIPNQYLTTEKNNLYQVEPLFESNKETSIKIKHYWEEGDLLSLQQYCSSDGKIFHNF